MNAFHSLFSDLPSIAIEYICPLLDLMSDRGLDQRRLLSAGDIPPEALQHPGARVSVSRFLDVIAAADLACPDENWALDYGRSLGLSEHCLVAMPLVFSDDALVLARNGLAMISLRLPLCRLHASPMEQDLRIILEPLWSHHTAMDRALEVYIGTLDRFVSQMDKAYTVTLSKGQEREARRLAGALNQTVQCSDRDISLQVHGFADGNFLPGPLNRPNQEEALSAHVQQTLLLIRRYIMCDPGRRCTPEHVAQHIGTTPRTLNRYLRSAGQSFSQLRTDIRAARSRHFLRHSSLPIIEIADRLGYADQASFSKAFRSWTGQTPGEFRRRETAPTPRDHA